MCMMSGPARVYGTKIFSRLNARGENVLLYQMSLEARAELAMVLPIPRRDGGRFKFMDFSSYDTVFDDLARLFEITGAGRARARSPLAVEKVGSFDASFVPSLADFDRVDARFRLKTDIWEKLPAYKSWSFAVFQLRKGQHTIHPMGLAWETRFPGKCFFPTVHVHDGTLQAEADFDHLLFSQGIAASDDWQRSPETTSSSLRTSHASGFFRSTPVYRRTVTGRRRNADIWAPIAA